jgi:ABC-type antimicrobial peptide transport system permease subunit
MVRVRNTGPDAAERLRSLASQIDAGLQLGQLRTAADVEREATQWLGYVAWAVAAVTFSVLLLSAAGIYAMTSFTVARRQREIGIRTALGASPRRLLAGIFARTSAQLGAGVLAGLVLAAGLDRLVGDALGDRRPVLLPAVAALMVMVGLLAALGPARRGLAVQPIDALRED